MIRAKWFLFLLLTAGHLAEARNFSNSFLSFDIPDSWICLQEGVAWVCSPKGPKDENEAVIVMAAKVASPEDKLENFQAFLSKPKTLTTRIGTPMPSQVMYAQERVLDKTKWIQAQHVGSEVQDFFTLYVATVKESLAILITFSSERNKYKNYNPIFDHAMKTLKLSATQNLVFPKNTGAGGIGVFGITGDQTDPNMLPPPPPRRSKLPFALMLLGLALVLVATAAYLYKPKNKKK